MKWQLTLFVFSCFLAALIPLGEQKSDSPKNFEFPGWPTHLFNEKLTQEPLHPLEASLAKKIPGLMARFRLGNKSVLILWLTEPTRLLHPREHCLRAAGYEVKLTGGWTDQDGHRWGTLQAQGLGKKLRVLERTHDSNGNSYPDPSSWYWSALWGKTTGPWWHISLDETIANHGHH